MAMTLLQFAAQFFPNDGTAMGVAIQLNKSSLLMPLMRVQQTHLVHKFGREESSGQIVRRVLNKPFPDANPGVVVPAESRMELAGAVVEVDHRINSDTEGKAQANEIARRTRGVGRYIDKQVINGNGATAKDEIVGLRDRIADEQLLSAGDNGAVLTLTMFEDLIDAVEDEGAGRIVLANKAACRKIKRLIVATASGASLAEVSGGVMEYEGVKIVPTGKDEARKDVLQFNETQGASEDTTSIYCIAPGATDDTGTNILMASNSIEVLPLGLKGSMQQDQLEVAFGVEVFTKTSAARLRGVKVA